MHAARQQDRRLAAALLAAALPHTAEAGEVVNGARTRMSRKPAALARELLRNFPKGGKGRRGQRRRKKGKGGEGSQTEALEVGAASFDESGEENGAVAEKPKRRRSQGGGGSRRGRARAVKHADPDDEAPGREDGDAEAAAENGAVEEKPKRGRTRARAAAASDEPKVTTSRSRATEAESGNGAVEETPKRTRSRAVKATSEDGACLLYTSPSPRDRS